MLLRYECTTRESSLKTHHLKNVFEQTTKLMFTKNPLIIVLKQFLHIFVKYTCIAFPIRLITLFFHLICAVI